ncbi:methyltransferase domain-containing protein [Mongoliimonas terrestris]|uniref:methyltransferase domain-containing protein n=1 Tax=Mongoliimonas terrestris TaxID=1709001 RepID=UPI0009494FD1|nr:methyltransferase domain-containing protein [Mongoliimonas terrestris]
MSSVNAQRRNLGSRLLRLFGIVGPLSVFSGARIQANSLQGGALNTGALNTGVVAPRLATGLKGFAPGETCRAETLFRRQMRQHGQVRRVLEIGHRGHSHGGWLEDGARHDQRDIVVDGMAIDVVSTLGDIPNGSYDAVFSVDTVEYVKSPWRVAEEIQRILKPGGLTFHTTVFTTRYQPRPEDFFRFTPDGLKSLFEDMECLTAEFDATERRRDDRRRPSRDAGDIFGGSREGWRVHFCGRKPVLPR